MTTARKKLSLGNVTDRADDREVGGDRTRAWSVSPARAEQLKQRARDMRRNPTAAQTALWARLKDKQCGFTFNREVVMGSAIVDFACKTRWLVVETGGTPGIGAESEATLAALSDRKLTDVGVRVLRFADDAVLADTDAVVKAIKDELQKPFEKPRVERAG
jgi:very-short-patch-repair endonuclease